MCLVFRVWYLVQHFARHIEMLYHKTLNTKY